MDQRAGRSNRTFTDLKFSKQQKTCKIHDVLVGGHPGENPTVLIGSIFYRGHRIVSDPEKGIFDKQKAKYLLDREAELSIETGNPRIIDVVGDTTQALVNYIEFVASSCHSPILVDSSLGRVRLETVKHFANTEVAPRLIYNSIEAHYNEEELASIKECGIKSAVILAFNTKAIMPKARVKLLKENLLGAAQKAGVENMLIDTGVLDIPSISWATQTIWDIKEELGYPCGCAPANALHTSKKIKQKPRRIFEACGAASCVLPISWGADFIFYGPISYADWVYPACSTMDAMLAYGGQMTGIRPAIDHPLYKIF